MHDGPVGVVVAARIVDDDHARDHQPAIDVEREQATRECGCAFGSEHLGGQSVTFCRGHAATIFVSVHAGHKDNRRDVSGPNRRAFKFPFRPRSMGGRMAGRKIEDTHLSLALHAGFL